MTNATNTKATETKGFQLPARVAFLGRGIAIAGTKGAHGDAGWTMVSCDDREHALQVMRAFPQAAMPCWKRIEAA